MFPIILTVHSWLRWVILLVALLALGKHIAGLVRGSAYDALSARLLTAFSGLMDLQALIGLITLIAGWQAFSAAGFPLTQMEHLGAMLLAAIVAHLPARWKERPAAVRYRNGLLVVIAALVLIVLGISVLVGNRWVLRGL